MADPIWIDSTTIGYITAGDAALEAELVGLAGGGARLMVPKVQEEVTVGNPFKKNSTMGPTTDSQAREEVIKRLNIQIDMMGDRDEIRRLYETQFKFKPPGKGTAVRAMEESDAIILSQVAASAKARNVANPRFFTSDIRLVNNADAKLWKVAIFGRSTPPTPSGMGGRMSPTADIPLNISASPRGQANAGAMVAVFIIVDTLTQYLNRSFASNAVTEELNKMEHSVRDWQSKYPTDGVLVSVNFVRTEYKPDPLGVMKNRLLIHAGDHLEFIDLFFASTPEEAAKQLRGQQSWVQGDGEDSAYQRVRTRTVFWVAPRVKEVPLTSPEGRWRVQVDPFTWTYEFSHQGTVKWTDVFNNETGQGKWKIAGDHMTFQWSSNTVERWNLPLHRSRQTGTCLMEGVTHKLTAEKI